MRLPVFAFLLLPALATASGGQAVAAHGPDWTALGRHLVNLVLFLGLLYWAGKTPIRDFLALRRQEVRTGLEEAWEAKARAEAKAAEVERRLAEFDRELTEMLTQVRKDGEAERARLEQNARYAAALMEATTRRSIADEVERARQELQVEAVDAALRMAEELVGKRIDANDQKRLADHYVAEVGKELSQ
jgi:F-type H+-transporting ATPase subunit b